VQNASKHEFGVQSGGSGAFIAKNSVAPIRPILHRSLCSNETVRNSPKHEFGVQCGGSGAFVAKTSDATSLHELVH
jgi:hypothetical protein